ncbi:MAG: tetratricopeptide repeat protein [Pirellulales bacterium]
MSKGTEAGEVTNMTPLAVTISKGLGGSRTVAVNEIKSVQFADEPTELSQARLNVANGAYANAVTALSKIDAKDLKRDFIKQDFEFYQAICAARLALGGSGEITDAGRQLNTFVRTYPNNFHYLAACEAMGDLLMAADKYEFAERQYAELDKTPWPDHKMRASVAIGRSLQAQGKHDDAIEQFDAALAMATDAPDAQNQKLSATLGKAISLAQTGSVEQAVGTIEKVIQDADPEEKELHARAYNALGSCYEKGGQKKDALLAFLHVDIVYASVPNAHAEALAHLATLWQAVGQEQRAREARQTLKDRYGSSKWAKQ